MHLTFLPTAPQILGTLDGSAPSSLVAATDPPAVPALDDGAEAWWHWFLGVPLRVVLIVVVSLVVLVVLRSAIRHVAEKIAADDPPAARGLMRANPLAGARRAQRARTIGSVLRSSANILVISIMLLLVLDALGMNIAPFIASAGIVGVALGFGAQSLVKDFLSGIFMLLEDQYGVGDTVDLGDVTGTVEEVQLRVTKVRDIEGTLWFVRNGEILRTGNMSQEWSRTLVEIPVPLTADVEQVRGLLTGAAARVTADPVLGAYVLEDPEVTGIESIAAGRLTFRVRIKTQPSMQWEVARALRVAIRDDFAAADVALAVW
ncbi:small conductance mechanosensitive channel [Sediminihabitans luteus]|uniref:Small conductance mechanosensitive channel n=1 Tax=Sediminihabitans luteus TaxID=1138585 RepID=A0A2M9CY43_9CELL|nr:mechanosensitive ion channel family protein [Sediminihabitans luteus]PJJ76839.1 small conductance mechanosensitive channel [Sediminihabitans luteus]GIJ00318.1 hypothetical protein Slu03_26950 [Sediminihabitans luteus]